MAENESAVSRWLERKESPPTLRERLRARWNRFRERCGTWRSTVVGWVAARAGQRLVGLAWRTKMRWIAGGLASLSGVGVATWMAFFWGPATPVEPPAEEFAGLANVSTTEVPPAPLPSRPAANIPGMVELPDETARSLDRPSPFYTREHVERAVLEVPESDGSDAAPENAIVPVAGSTPSPVWLVGTIEEIDDVIPANWSPPADRDGLSPTGIPTTSGVPTRSGASTSGVPTRPAVPGTGAIGTRGTRAPFTPPHPNRRPSTDHPGLVIQPR